MVKKYDKDTLSYLGYSWLLGCRFSWLARAGIHQETDLAYSINCKSCYFKSSREYIVFYHPEYRG